MMERMWNDILKRFGQQAVLRSGESEVPVKALIQPCLTREREQQAPTPMGLGRQDLFRYMGPAEHPIRLDTLVEWKGREYRVQSAHLVGERVCPHWWAILYPRDEVAV